MKKRIIMNDKNLLLVFLICFLSISLISGSHAQDIRWLRVGELQSPYNEVGAEYEVEFSNNTSNYFSWPAQYSIDQTVTRMKCVWIGCTDFDDPVEKKVKGVKIIGSGPKSTAMPDQVFPQEIKLIGKFAHPAVTVDDVRATVLDQYDILDEIDPDLPCDRMVYVRYNTSIGITVTKKIMAFAQPEHGNYHINEWVFKNTGIVDAQGNEYPQTLSNVWFYFFYRYAFGGLTAAGSFSDVWGGFNSLWGESTLNHGFGQNPNASAFTDQNSPLYQMRGFYSYYGPYDKSPRPPYDADWGCPKLDDPGAGTLGSAKFAGCVTLHADKGPGNEADDATQPHTTWHLSPDITIMSNTSPSQYDEIFMNDRWAAMTEGHPPQQHDEMVGDNYPNNYKDSRRNAGGGVGMGQGFGPYTIAAGESIRIVFAEGVSGISWEKGREIGSNWLKWFNTGSGPSLKLPDGSTTTDYNEYKRAWVVDTGRDSILATYRLAKENFDSDYTLPQPPPPPEEFSVNGGGDRIQLTWASNATTHPHFGGYVIYRSEGNILDWQTVYQKIYETDDANLTSFSDTTAKRGFDYFYYIQTKDDGTQVPGTTLYSSMFWTVTSIGALLGRPAGSALAEVRVVPNPYDIRSRMLQFGDQSQYDRIAFYGLPPLCKLKIFTERGDLIWEKDHTTTTGDEIWDSMTSSGQIITSGIYILYVETPEGESVTRKFVVIR
ncbi:hypothetical protein JXB12_10390 [candidate division KSB1 bacterium]|nr:hypothetical protein [candidate division KSB1 bacterium]